MPTNTNNIGANFVAKGDILAAISAATPQVIPVGADGDFLSTDSTTMTKISNEPLSSNISWTPTIAGSTSIGTATYLLQTGIYSTVGDLVFLWGAINFTGFTGTGNLNINLPIAADLSNSTTQTGLVIFDGTYSAGDNIILFPLPQNAIANILTYGSSVPSTVQQCVAAANIQFFVFYGSS